MATERGPDVPAGFRAVDEAADPDWFATFVDQFSALPATEPYKRQAVALLQVRDGDQVLEVGCGAGNDVLDLAPHVGRTGRVVGVDSSETMVAAARRQAQGRELPVTFQLGDADRLDFADASFDACRSIRTFQHLAHPTQALAELVRVARSGARLVLVEPDWDTLVIDAPDRALTRRIVTNYCDGIRNGWIGRQLPRLFRQAGLEQIAVAPTALQVTDYATMDALGWWGIVDAAQQGGAVSPAEAAAWLRDVAALNEAGLFYLAVTMFVVGGRKA